MSKESPCIDICKLDPLTQLCIGCYRTIEEITAWASYSDRERLEVWNALAGRRAQFNFDHKFDKPEPNPDCGAPAKTKCCGRCGADFVCEEQVPGAQCWCASLPHIAPPMRSSNACLCPNCLTEAIEKTLQHANLLEEQTGVPGDD
ncbi:MAG: cysteine-rich CWC family protein [Burkholderiales bacterium]|nr:cysteine-rich CWC family protein [Burkholderiales bacterium]